MAQETQPREGGILIISGLEILCKCDLSRGPIIAHEFRIYSEEGRHPYRAKAVADVKCPACGELTRVEFV